MADVTISSLPLGTPSGNVSIPYSDGNTTYKTSPSAIVAASFTSGSWTPVANIWTNASDVTVVNPNLFFNGSGTYVKINNMVYISFLIVFPGITYDGYVVKYVTGLPFPVSNAQNYSLSLYEPRGFNFRYGTSATTNCKLTLSIIKNYGQSDAIVTQATDNSQPFSGWWQLQAGSGKQIGGSGWYIAE